MITPVDYKIILGVIAVLLGLISYVHYFYGIFFRNTQPHAFSWLVWGVVTGIAFAGQVADGGGPGTWNTGFTFSVMFVVAGVAMWKHGIGYVTQFDIVSFVAAILAIVPWIITQDPLLSVIMVVIIDTAGFLPSFRKAWVAPYEESSFVFSLSALKFAIAIAALDNFTVITMLFPLTLVITNTLYVLMLLWRRGQLKSIKKTAID